MLLRAALSWPLNRQVLLMANEWHWGLLGMRRFWQSKSPFLRPKIPASLVLTGFIQPRSRRRCRHEGERKVSGTGCASVTGRAHLRGLQALTPSFPPTQLAWRIWDSQLQPGIQRCSLAQTSRHSLLLLSGIPDNAQNRTEILVDPISTLTTCRSCVHILILEVSAPALDQSRDKPTGR